MVEMVWEMPHKGKFTVIRDDTEEARLKIIAYKWSIQLCNGHYVAVARNETGERVQLHRWMIGAKPDQFVKPLDGNYLNVQKSNLGILSRSQVAFDRCGKKNSTGYRGVIKGKGGKFKATIAGVTVGTYDTAEQAARAYDEQALKVFGKRVNFPDTEETTHNDTTS